MTLLAENHTSALEGTMRSALRQLEDLSSSAETNYSEKQLELLISDEDVGKYPLPPWLAATNEVSQRLKLNK
jgi:hypothetical protein